MKSQYPTVLKTDPIPRWQTLQLPIGIKIACTEGSFEKSPLEISLPTFDGKGMVLTFLHYKGDLYITTNAFTASSAESDRKPAYPGLGLLCTAGQSLFFHSDKPIQFFAIALFLPEDWISLFLKGNGHFSNIEEILERDKDIITCRMGRRQISILSSLLCYGVESPDKQLEIQNSALCLLEYFLCNQHRSVLGAHTSSGIENEDDLTLVREVESYISEYYCSDTFTVDSILKKTYTSYHRLNFLFKSIHGMTISEFIRNKRIEKSKEMIVSNAKSISQIAYEIGYSSISNYILAFKKIYQITPGRYKKQMEA